MILFANYLKNDDEFMVVRMKSPSRQTVNMTNRLWQNTFKRAQTHKKKKYETVISDLIAFVFGTGWSLDEGFMLSLSSFHQNTFIRLNWRNEMKGICIPLINLQHIQMWFMSLFSCISFACHIQQLRAPNEERKTKYHFCNI